MLQIRDKRALTVVVIFMCALAAVVFYRTRMPLPVEELSVELLPIEGDIELGESPVQSGNDHMPFDIIPAQGEHFYYSHEHFTLSIPSSWQKIATSALVLPAHVTDPAFAFRHQAQECVIAYVKYPRQESNGEIYQQTRYHYQFPVEGETITVGREVDVQYEPDDVFQKDRAWTPYIPYEIATIPYPRDYNDWKSESYRAFVLFAPDGKTISRECDEAYVGMLVTLRRLYETTNLSPQDSGLIHVFNTYKGIWRILFADTSGAIEREVMQVEDTGNQLYAYNDYLYAIRNGNLLKIDIFAKTITPLPEVLPENRSSTDVINEAYFYDNKLFYLFGSDCNDYKAWCDLRLYEYDFAAKSLLLRIEHVTDREIIGFLPEQRQIYLAYFEGDAGVVWGSYTVYDLTNGTIVEKIDASGEYGAPGYEKILEQRKAIAGMFADQVRVTNFLAVENGTLVPADSASNKITVPIRYFFK